MLYKFFLKNILFSIIFMSMYVYMEIDVPTFCCLQSTEEGIRSQGTEITGGN